MADFSDPECRSSTATSRVEPCLICPLVLLFWFYAFILPILCIHVSPVSILDGLSRPTESCMDEQDKQDENLNPTDPVQPLHQRSERSQFLFFGDWCRILRQYARQVLRCLVIRHCPSRALSDLSVCNASSVFRLYPAYPVHPCFPSVHSRWSFATTQILHG